MVRPCVAAFAVAGLLLAMPGQGHAAGDLSEGSYRLGVGWDEGIGLRHRVSNNWGLGLQFKPGLAGESRTDQSYDAR